MEKTNFFSKNKSIVIFLILEIVALVAFNFGNIVPALSLIGALLAIVAFVFVYFTIENKKELIKLSIPVLLLFVVSTFTGFNQFSKGFTIVSNIAVFLAVPGFFVLGYCIRKLGESKIKLVLLVIGASFALLTLIGMFATLIDYGFFYSLIYKIKGTTYYYYNGVPYDVTAEMYWLVGFEFTEVAIEYGGLFALLCACYLPSLLFVSPKKNRNEFVVLAVIGGIGLLSILLVPNFKALVVLVVASVFAFVWKYLKSKKNVLKVIGFSFVAIVSLGILFFVIALINAAAGFKLTGILNRVFVQNRIMQGPTQVFAALFSKTDGVMTNIFGINVFESVIQENTGIFEVELLKETGIIGTFVVFIFIIGMGYFVYRYLRKSKDADQYKVTLIVMLLAILIYCSLFNEIIPQTHNSISYYAILRSSPFLIMLFLFGYIFFSESDTEDEKDEK